jgi:HEAT repeat protein
MRALLCIWEDSAGTAVLAGLADEAWRVREMAAKVIARRQLGEALAGVAELRGDPVVRVRTAAARALTILTAAQA